MILNIYESLINVIFICLHVLYMISEYIQIHVDILVFCFQGDTIPGLLEKQTKVKVQLRIHFILRIPGPK